VAVRQAALVSDESALEACAIQIDDLYLLPFTDNNDIVVMTTIITQQTVKLQDNTMKK